jgi:hypothetical protein
VLIFDHRSFAMAAIAAMISNMICRGLLVSKLQRIYRWDQAGHMGHVMGPFQHPSLPSGRWLPNLGSSVISPSDSLAFPGSMVCGCLWHQLWKGYHGVVDLPESFHDEILVVPLLSNFRHHPINSLLAKKETQ